MNRRNVVIGAISVLIGVGLLILLSRLADPAPRTSLPRFITALARSGDVTFVTLDPAARNADATRRRGPELRGWPIIGRATIRSYTAMPLVRALNHGGPLPEDWPGCFEPRHGLVMRNGLLWADVVICFECGQARSTYGIGPITLAKDFILLQGDARTLFNALAAREHLPVAP